MILRVVLSLLAAFLPASALASQTCVLLDRSGSMKKHYISADGGSPLVKELASSMVQAASASAKPDLFAFDTKVVPLRDLDDTNFQATNNDTALTAALQSALRNHRHIWLLTDNVQDVPTPGKPHDQDMSDFYSLLRSPQIKSIHIFPVLERADLKQQGVLVYAISTVDESDSGGKSDFDDEIAAFKQQLTDNPRLNPLQVQELWMKPLGRHALDVNLKQSNGPHEFAVGDPLKLEAKVVITAKSYLYFEESPVNTDSETSTANVFLGAPCLEVEKKDAHVTPETVRTDSTVEYTVAVDYGQVRLHKSLSCIWTAAFVSSRVGRQINTPLTVRVPKGRFHFTPAFVQRFTAESESDAREQGKIAGLKALPENLADEETVIPIFVPAEVIIRYPVWPGLLLGLIAILLIAGAVGILVALKGTFGRKRAVSVQLVVGDVLPSSIKGGALLVNDRIIGRIDADKFVPSQGVRLEDGTRSASTNRPIRCTLTDGRKVIITFGAGSASNQSAPPSGPAAPTRKVPPSAPRRR